MMMKQYRDLKVAVGGLKNYFAKADRMQLSSILTMSRCTNLQKHIIGKIQKDTLMFDPP